ncbi:MAG: Pyrimidine 5-nucleotidase YjjG [Firmicutes bacterium]|nr:Pyrimidine 5-nucleotidase YjjG [Bacillota bacterium]
MIKGAIFDLDGTLYEYEAIDKIAMNELEDYTCKLLSINSLDFNIAFKKGKVETKSILYDCAAQHNRLLYCQKTCENLGVSPAIYALDMYEVYWGTMLEHMKLNNGVMELFQRLKCRNIKTAICTDLTAHIQYRKIRKLGLEKYIDYIVTSEEIGIEKPSEKMFQACLTKLKLMPEETFYIGDSFKKDIIGASRMGILTIWYNVNEEEVEADGRAKYLNINTFYDERLLSLC